MTNKTALVTGAAAGIGRAISRRIARDGVAVGVVDLDLEGCKETVKMIEEEGGRAIALKMDVTNRDEIQAGLDALRSAFGPVTILVNNAGITRFKAFEEESDEDWARIFDINMGSILKTTQLTLPDMKAAGWGRIVNISSSSAQTGASHMTAYSSTKGAVIVFTKSLAREMGPHGITVNNIPPSAVMNTLMSEKSFQEGLFGKMSRTDLAAQSPLNRHGEPEDIAGMAAYLISDEASYVTGQTMGVNGGRVIY